MKARPVHRDVGQEAHDVHQRLLALKYQAAACFLAMGRLLRQVREERLYLPLGHETFEGYLSELEISRSFAWKLIANAVAYAPVLDEHEASTGPADQSRGETPAVAYGDLLTMGVEKAYAVRHFVAEGPPAAAAEWVEKAKTLSVVDLTREVRHVRAGNPASAQFDYLVGVGRRLMALAGGLAESDEPRRLLADIRAVCLDAEAWLEREGP
jgi:hypothetical protein